MKQADALGTKSLARIARLLPFVGAFVVLGQVFGPAQSLLRYRSGTPVPAEFVNKVRFATGGSSSRSVTSADCAYNYKLAEDGRELYLIRDCHLLPGTAPVPGQKYSVVIYQQTPPLIVSSVSYSIGWFGLFTILVGFVLILLPRRLVSFLTLHKQRSE